MAKLLVHAGVMELQSIELEVCLRKSPLLIADLGVIFGLAGCGLDLLGVTDAPRRSLLYAIAGLGRPTKVRCN